MGFVRRCSISLLGNILWILLGGLPIAVGYFSTGIALCLTVIGIPFGLQNIKIGVFTLLPFGKEAIVLPQRSNLLYIIFNIIWCLSAGIIIAFTHLCLALLCAITIVGIPFAMQHLKLVGLSLAPFGMTISETQSEY